MPKFDTEPYSEYQNDRVFPSTSGTFYGWWIVLAGTIILFVSSGIGFYGHGVILDPLRELHGWSKATVSLAVTLYFFTSGIIGMIIGRQVDRYGPKWVLIFGSVIIGIGFVLLSFITKIWQLYIVYIMMAVGFSCTSLVPVNTLIANWFIRKRGFAMSLTNTGLSVGGILLVPLASYIILRWGLKGSLPILGALFWIIIIPTAIIFIKKRPSDINQFPDGEPPPASPRDGRASAINYSAQIRVWTRFQAARTAAFWFIVIAFLLALAGQIAFLVHQVSFLSQYLGIPGAATAVSLTAAASIIGRLWLGTFVDRCDNRHVIMVCFLIQSVAVITLAHYHHIVILYLGTFAFGLTMGNIIMMQALIIGDCFGFVSFATVSGLAGVFTMSGASFGPVIAGIIYDATQSYRTAFTLFAAVSLVAVFFIYFAKPPDPEQ